jgi:hypothetical protein
MSELSRIVSPGIEEILAKKKQETKSELNCMSIGKVVQFFPEDQTAHVQISFLRVIKAASANSDEQPVDRTIKYPVLVKCPVVILNGGGAFITFPIQAGDVCLVLFCDRDLDNWWSTEQELPPNSERLHDLSDGVALVGIKSQANPLDNYYIDRLQLRFGTSFITIEEDGTITIEGEDVIIRGNGTVQINP